MPLISFQHFLIVYVFQFAFDSADSISGCPIVLVVWIIARAHPSQLFAHYPAELDELSAPRQCVLQFGQPDLQLCFVRESSLIEDLENEEVPVDHAYIS